MEKSKRSEAGDGEIPLPEAIIQHIQSFLDGKQAAQTSILSKSWYNAWLTRPNLDFDERNFQDGDPRAQNADEFLEFVKNTFERYQELNLMIENLKLWMKSTKGDRSSFAHELIVKALKMGVNDLNFEFHPPSPTFILPYEVLAAETLTGLSVIGCIIDRPVDGRVNCSRLKFLCLCRVCIEDDVVWDIIKSCPLIEKLILSECKSFVEIAKLNVVRKVTKMLTLSSQSIESGNHVGSMIDRPMKVSEFHRLKFLLLDRVNIDSLFFHDFSSKFPCLEDMTLHYCYGYKAMQISSRSLKFITLSQTRMLRAKFDLPNIHKFSFSGSSFPSLSFTTASGEWKSCITIRCCHYRVNAKWFLELRKCLTKLSQSKITLSIWFFLEKCIDYEPENDGLSRPVVENLMLSMHSQSSVCSALLDGLFWSCRPKAITQYWFPRSRIADKVNNEFLELLCERLIQQVSQNCCIPNQIVFGLHDLEEVNVEYFEETLAEWRPLPWKTLLDASTGPEKRQKVRFQLKWRST